jgi:hypothetical protein
MHEKQQHNMTMGKNKTENESLQSPFAQTFFHGTKVDLKMGNFAAMLTDE